MANVVGVVAAEFGKSRKILGRKQHLRSLVHSLQIEGRGQLPSGLLGEGVFVGLNVVAILPLGGVKSCVGIVCHGVDAPESHIFGQEGVEMIDKILGLVDGARGVEVCHIEGCVNARVGAPSAHNVNLLPQERGECLLDGLFHRTSIGLSLPATI